MPMGKLTHEQLQRYVFDQLQAARHADCGPAIGEDCAEVALASPYCILSTDPITAGGDNIGTLAVHICCNDIAATGASPVGLMLTLLCPPDTSPEQIAAIMQQVQQAAAPLGVDILGGHTEWTDAVTRPVIAATVIACRQPDAPIIRSSGMRPGDALVLTKTAGLEGSAILATQYPQQLAVSCTPQLLDEARGYLRLLSVLPEGRAAAQLAGTHAMHDITEGGVVGAAWEVAQASNCGLELDPQAVPVTPATAAICKAAGVDPLFLISSGCMLIATANPELLVSTLAAQGIAAAVIGRALPPEQGRRFADGRPLPPPCRDALYDAMAALQQA